jgi:hypothetical protein
LWIQKQGECGERRQQHSEEAEKFYRDLQERGVRVRMEAGRHARWFEALTGRTAI